MKPRSPWPPLPGSYVLGNPRSPVAIAVVGKARFDLPSDRYCILGQVRSANIGIEMVIANIVSNPCIRYLIICGPEEGHLPGDALISVARNGVDDDMRIRGTKAQLPFLADLNQESVERFKEQVTVIDLVYPKDSDGSIDWQDPPFPFDTARTKELDAVIDECERLNPGMFPDGPMSVEVPRPFRYKGNIGAGLKDQVDRVSSLMLRMPSEQLNTYCDIATISPDLEVVLDPIDGAVIQVPSISFYERMRDYLMGK